MHAWAATVVFAATGRPPYGKGPAMAIMDRVRRGEHDLSGVPDAARRGCCASALDPEPLERPTVRELRASIDELRQRAHLAARAAPEPELWTMPFAPHGAGDSTPAPTGAARPAAPEPAVPDGRARAGAAVRARPRPVPRHADRRPTPRPSPPTRRSPTGPAGCPGRRLRARRPAGPSACCSCSASGRSPAPLVAYAPYAGTALVAAVVLLLRTASVTRQRHGRRRLVRGRPRWYDVPTTTLSLPGYLLLALFGALVAGRRGRPVAAGDVLAGLPARASPSPSGC